MNNIKQQVVSQVVAGLKKLTGKDYSQQVDQMITEELRLLLEIARLTSNPEALKKMNQAVVYHREQSAVFFSTVLRNQRIAHAIRNNLNRYFDAWCKLWYCHNYMIANRVKMKRFFQQNLGVDVPVDMLHTNLEYEAFKRNTPTKPLAPRQEGG